MKNFNNDAVVPFLWVRDEDEKTIEKEIDAIKALSINAFMIESRPRVLSESDFATESWFKRVGKILAYAQKLNMKVWLLDDKSFPTGSANGKINLKYPHLRAKQLKCIAIDIVLTGQPSFLLTGVKENSNDRIIYACLSSDNELTEIKCEGRERIVKVPNLTGLYRAYFLIETEDSPERDGYIDMLNPESVDVLLEEVYKPHYERFKEYFGSTFAGYFSDEPRFCNGVNWYYGTPVSMYDYNLGKINLAYPISNVVYRALKEKGYCLRDFLCLFTDKFDNYRDFRIDYMNIITDEYSKNFVGKLSKWCSDRGVLYTGHVIEDMGVHMTLGCGAGHYFKAMRGADYAGIDVVLHQIKPFYLERESVSPVEGGIADGKFFNFTLAKLASSVAVQSDTAKGNSVCEIFGAYGWGESVSDMLYLVNHMAVMGINHFIPHAFSMELYDKDCPPYFYGQGKNPSYEGYKKLFEYMQCLSQYSRKSYANIAVFYNAESVWSGDNYLSIDEVAKVLIQNQLEFDFIDKDNLISAEKVNGKIKIRDCEYSHIIVPDGYLTQDTKKLLDCLNVDVIYLEEQSLLSLIGDFNNPFKLAEKNKFLRVKKVDRDSYMLFNEGLESVNNCIFTDEKLYLIDCLNKKILKESVDRKLNFSLSAGQALFATAKLPLDYEWAEKLVCHEVISKTEVFIKAFDEQEFVALGEKNILYTPCEENYNFSGAVRYEFNIFSKGDEYLSVDYYGEFMKIEMEGIEKTFISSPAVVKIPTGKNIVKISVSNTLANAMKDALSMYSNISSCGLKSVKICVKE